MGNPVHSKEHLSLWGSDSCPVGPKRCPVTVTTSDRALTGSFALMDLHFLHGSPVQSLKLSGDHWL